MYLKIITYKKLEAANSWHLLATAFKECTAWQATGLVKVLMAGRLLAHLAARWYALVSSAACDQRHRKDMRSEKQSLVKHW